MRVFVSVGTHPQQFDRLVQEIDRIAERGKMQFFAQTGNCGYEPKNFAFQKSLSAQQFGERIAWADVVVSHGGAGTIISSMLQKKRLVVVPRLKRFGEHTNDHQLDLARALERNRKVVGVERIGDLGKAIERAASFKPSSASNKQGLVSKLRQFLGA